MIIADTGILSISYHRQTRSQLLGYAFSSEWRMLLEDFYSSQVDDNSNALQIFERKLRRWVKTPTDSYIGVWGELYIADWLARHQILHGFIQETQGSQSPDIELTVVGRKVYFEIKTLQENRYDWFAQRLLPSIQTHVSRVIEKLGKTEFVNVAGVIISDPFLEWGLVENISYPEYGGLKRIGLFDAIDRFQQRHSK